MGAVENLATHSRWTEAENRHDLSHHHEFLHETIELFAGGETIVGIDAFRTSLEASFCAFPDFHVVLDDRFATDDRLVCRWRQTGTHEGEFFGIPATGKQIEVTGLSLWEFDHDKARRGWAMLEVASLMRQLGLA